ncbi:16340_t:CDS:2 [Dentiscutata erythropus]|uniref:16340_t:CDS:1 n=1 Tax=Dentiscutata erythropus TaxID=1348616 RepID=A0A9N9DIG6_9GLOM|nr:16340_t:CDS:2 [Dentiscutata erythropus]
MNIDRLNRTIANTSFGKYFKLENSGASNTRDTQFTTELRAGLTTFFAMAYIVAVNAAIVADSGGPCVCQNPDIANTCIGDPDYAACQMVVKRDIITATAAVSCLASAIMGIFANLPLGLAPGQINFYLVGFHGGGNIPYTLAKLIPKSIKNAAAAGIGLFLCFIGFQKNTGIALIATDPTTVVSLGGCPDQYFNSTTGACTGHHMESPITWFGVLGFLIIAILLLYKVKGSLLLGITFISVVSWFRNSQVTYFPYTPDGDERFDFFKNVVGFHSIENNKDIWIALITFLYVDIFDATGTIYSMAKFGGFTDETGDFEGATAAYICDASSISIGAIFGLPPVTAFVESGAGIMEGGRTGITALTISFFFFISLFFAPIFASLPPWATGPALVVVGSIMVRNIKNINWDYVGDAMLSFLTIAIMPLTFNIAYGLIAEPWDGPGDEGLLPLWLVDITYKARKITKSTTTVETETIEISKEQMNNEVNEVDNEVKMEE